MNKYKEKPTLNNTTVASSLISTGVNGRKRPSVRALRWVSIILIHFMFVLSFRADIQVLEGTLVGSRFLGFHMIDPFVSLQYIAANKAFPVNLTIGTITVILLYLVFGRAFCSWACPYGLLSELGEKLNAVLVRKKIIRQRKQPRHINYLFWGVFLFICFVTGYLVFELVNVMGIMSRLIIYGIWGAALIVLGVLLFEILYARRIWCRSICPVGATYGLLNRFSAVKVAYKGDCDNCGSCKSVCYAPHLLSMTGTAIEAEGKDTAILGADCIMCGRCVDVCHKDTLKYVNRLKKLV